MKCRFRAGRSFWRSWSRLRPDQQEAARKVFRLFRESPFDARLRTHKIHRLSSYYGRTIHAVEIAGDLRVAFYLEGDPVWSVDIGTHSIYRG